MIEKKAIHQRSEHLWNLEDNGYLCIVMRSFKEKGTHKSKTIKNKNNKNAYV